VSDPSKTISPKPASDAGSEPIQSDSAALQELALSEARYRALVEGSSDFIYVLDPDGCFIFATTRSGTCSAIPPKRSSGDTTPRSFILKTSNVLDVLSTSDAQGTAWLAGWRFGCDLAVV
jgi:hypothetical protein